MFVYVFMIKDSDNGNNIDDNGDDDIHKDINNVDNETYINDGLSNEDGNVNSNMNNDDITSNTTDIDESRMIRMNRTMVILVKIMIIMILGIVFVNEIRIMLT